MINQTVTLVQTSKGYKDCDGLYCTGWEQAGKPHTHSPAAEQRDTGTPGYPQIVPALAWNSKMGGAYEKGRETREIAYYDVLLNQHSRLE